MTTAANLYQGLLSRGVKLRAGADGRLGCRAPAGAITPELRTAIADHRDELVRHLVLEEHVTSWPLERRQRWADRALELMGARAVTTSNEQLQCELDAALELLGEQVN